MGIRGHQVVFSFTTADKGESAAKIKTIPNSQSHQTDTK